ncbi:MAG: TolC family protein [Bacteroidota bacterium]
MRRLLMYTAICMVAIGMTTTANAQQDATPLSLQQCINYALIHNAAVKNALLDVKIQKAQNDQLVSAAYPKLNGKVELDDFFNPQKSFIDASTFNTTGKPLPPNTVAGISFSLPYAASLGLSASQVIFDGSVLVAVQARNSVMELARQSGKLTEEEVRYNVQKAYHALVIAGRQLAIIKSSLANARSMARDLEITRANGFAEKIDVDRTNVQVNNLATDSLRISNMLTLSRQLLKYQIGMDINQHIVLTDTAIDEHLLQASTLVNEQLDYSRRTEYNLNRTQLKLYEYNVKRYKLTALPSIAAFGAMGYNYGQFTFGDVMKFSQYAFNSMAGLQINVPIYNGKLRQYQLKEAQLNVEKTNNNLENIKQTIDFQTAQARSSLKNSLLQLESQKRNMELSNTVLDLAHKKYAAGVGSNVEVTQAQTDQLQSQNNYFSSLLDVVNAEADLLKALGQFK